MSSPAHRRSRRGLRLGGADCGRDAFAVLCGNAHHQLPEAPPPPDEPPPPEKPPPPPNPPPPEDRPEPSIDPSTMALPMPPPPPRLPCRKMKITIRSMITNAITAPAEEESS